MTSRPRPVERHDEALQIYNSYEGLLFGIVDTHQMIRTMDIFRANRLPPWH